MKTPKYFFVALLSLLSMPTFAQERPAALPDYATLQYAGSIGWLSLGVEYDTFRERGRWGIKYGYVPKSMGGELHIVSASLFYEPLKVRLSERFTINPVDAGMTLTYHFGDNFHSRWPSRYPDGYYWWTTTFLLHLAAQPSITWTPKNDAPFKALTGYVEFNTNDLYLVSFIQNPKSLRWNEVVKMGLGLRVRF